MKLMLRIVILIVLVGSGNAFSQSAVSTTNALPPTVAPVSRAPSSGYGSNGNAYGTLLGALRGSRHSQSVFVIPAQETPIEALLAVNEDMTVMMRIFDHALEQANLRGRAGNPYMPLLGQVGRSTPSVYLEGYGALFTISVDFPLAPGSQVQETTPQEGEPEVDQLWQQVRADMFEPQQLKRRDDPYQDNAPQYNAQQVESLKATLIAALKHAANIRVLDADEAVVVTVVGASGPGSVQGIKNIPGSDDYEVISSEGIRSRISADRLADVGRSAPTVLMIRAQVSAITAFAQGQLSLAQFRAQVRMVEYPNLGQMNSANSDPFLPSFGYGAR